MSEEHDWQFWSVSVELYDGSVARKQLSIRSARIRVRRIQWKGLAGNCEYSKYTYGCFEANV